MAKLDQRQNRYYPSKLKTGALHDDFRRLYDYAYQMQTHNAGLEKRLAALEDGHGKLRKTVENGPSTTKLQGLNIKAIRPQNGQKLTYNAATGEIEWQ